MEDKEKTKGQIYYEKNKVRLLAASRKWAKENPEASKANQKAWKQANKERCTQYMREWRAKKAGKPLPPKPEPEYIKIWRARQAENNN